MDDFTEKPVKAILTATAVLSFIAASCCAVFVNSKYLETFAENVLPYFAYVLASVFGFVLLGVFSITQIVLAARRKTVSEDAVTRNDVVNTSSGWIDVAATSKKFRRSREYSSKAKNAERFSAVIGVLCIVVFAAVFALSAPPKAIIEFTKKPVDRLVGDFRVVSDLVFSAFFLVTVILFTALTPGIVSGKRQLAKGSSAALAVVPAACAVRFGYFFFGNILAFASPVDFAIFGIAALTAGMFLFSGYASGRKKMIRELTVR